MPTLASTPRELLTLLAHPEDGPAEPHARALKHLAERSPESFTGLGPQILKTALATEDLRIRWNLTVVLSLVPLSPRLRAAAVDWLFERLADPSSLTRVFALQSLWNLSSRDGELRARIQPVARRFVETGTTALRARARHLLEDR